MMDNSCNVLATSHDTYAYAHPYPPGSEMCQGTWSPGKAHLVCQTNGE